MKQHVSFRIDGAVVRRLRNAVHHNRGAPHFLTLDAFVESALDNAATELERAHNGGKPFGAPPKKTRRAA